MTLSINQTITIDPMNYGESSRVLRDIILEGQSILGVQPRQEKGENRKMELGRAGKSVKKAVTII